MPSTAAIFTATIRVGSKDFTEEFIVGNMYALLRENAGAKADRKLNLGGTPVCQAAMEKGDLDLYPEYTGTGLVTVLKPTMRWSTESATPRTWRGSSSSARGS